jgi:hypothetical protein
MLPVVVAATQSKVLFGPNDLRTNPQPGRYQPSSHFGSMDPGMPDIGDIAWEELVGSRPVGLIVVGDQTCLPLSA